MIKFGYLNEKGSSNPSPIGFIPGEGDEDYISKKNKESMKT